MKRRKFIQNLGMGVTPIFVQPFSDNNKRSKGIPHYNYSQPDSLIEAVTKEGQIIVRLEFRMQNRHEQQIKPDIAVEKVCNINDGKKQPFTAFLKDFNLNYNLNKLSHIGGKSIEPMPGEHKWWHGKLMPSGNVAGEHHYHIENLYDLKY